MARRTLIWHIGLAHAPRAVVGANLHAHREALEAAGHRVVADEAEATRATHELLRTHREAGLSRVEVEGQWARICDRVWQHKGVSLLSTPDLCAADKDQLRLALDPLIGIEVHLVVTADTLSSQLYGGWLGELRSGRTTGWEKYAGRVLDHLGETDGHAQGERFWVGHDLPALVARWGWTFREDRLHVVAAPDPAAQWAAYAGIAGLSGVDEAVVPAYADPAGVAVLRRVNRQLDDPITGGAADLLVHREPAGMPVVDTSAVRPLLEEWATTLADSGYDVRGDLAALADEGSPNALPGPRDQLGVAVDALADALADNARLRTLVAGLEADNQRLDRKRRKLKRRMKSLSPVVDQN